MPEYWQTDPTFTMSHGLRLGAVLWHDVVLLAQIYYYRNQICYILPLCHFFSTDTQRTHAPTHRHTHRLRCLWMMCSWHFSWCASFSALTHCCCNQTAPHSFFVPRTLSYIHKSTFIKTNQVHNRWISLSMTGCEGCCCPRKKICVCGKSVFLYLNNSGLSKKINLPPVCW